MNYKALIADFDHTLVGNTLMLDPQIKTAIQKMITSGIIFSIATGRPYYDHIDTTSKELSLKNPLIVHGGAHLVDPVDGSVIWKCNMIETEVKRLLNFFVEKNIYFAVEGNNCIYTPDGNRIALHAPSTPFLSTNELKDYSVPKIMIPASIMHFSDTQIDTLIKTLENNFKDIHFLKIKVNVVCGCDITSSGGTKHIGVLEFMKYMNLNKEEVVGVGDGFNDYPLLTACGTKVAMGNAPDALKNIADFIAPPQNENGFLSVIEKFFS